MDDIIDPIYGNLTPEQVAEQKLQEQRYRRQSIISLVMANGVSFGLVDIDEVIAATRRICEFVQTGEA